MSNAGLRPFEDVNDELSDHGVFNPTRRVVDPVSIHLVYLGVDDLFCVANDREVGVVSNDDNLPPLLRMPESWDQRSRDCVVIQVLFRLIDHERDVPLVDEKVEEQQEVSSLTW